MTRDCATEIHRPRDVRRAQAAEREDILNVGGFSDQVFDIVSEFAAGRLDGDHWLLCRRGLFRAPSGN